MSHELGKRPGAEQPRVTGTPQQTGNLSEGRSGTRLEGAATIRQKHWAGQAKEPGAGTPNEHTDVPAEEPGACPPNEHTDAHETRDVPPWEHREIGELLITATASLQHAVEKPTRDNLKKALDDLIAAVTALLDAYNEYVAAADDSPETVQPLSAEETREIQRQLAAALGRNCDKVLTRCGYKPPPTQRELIADAQDAVYKIRSLNEDRRFEAQRALRTLKDRLEELRAQQDVRRWSRFTTDARPTVAQWTLAVLTGGAIGASEKGVEALVTDLVHAISGLLS